VGWGLGGGRRLNRFWIVGFRRKKCSGFGSGNMLLVFANLIYPADCVFILYFGSGCGFYLQFSSDPGL
jgi:hypothetical protein